jgi:hypothetical protein
VGSGQTGLATPDDGDGDVDVGHRRELIGSTRGPAR